VKLDAEEVALFDAILAMCATARAMDGGDAELAGQAAERAGKFIEERRKTIRSKAEPS
jgi:hypothetical protein